MMRLNIMITNNLFWAKRKPFSLSFLSFDPKIYWCHYIRSYYQKRIEIEAIQVNIRNRYGIMLMRKYLKTEYNYY